MSDIFQIITENIQRIDSSNDFIRTLFAKDIKEVKARPIVLFGAGSLGLEMVKTLIQYKITPIGFCDNNAEQLDPNHYPIPLLSFAELKAISNNVSIIISTEKYLDSIYEQLLLNNFSPDNIYCPPSDSNTKFLFMYAMVGTQHLLNTYRKECKDSSCFEYLSLYRDKIQNAYELYSDQKSKDLLISKLSVIASNGHFDLFKDFIREYSEPLHGFGPLQYDGTPEDYYYFENDILTLGKNESLLDVGAYDGDTVEAFIQACKRHNITFESIDAFEPDPICFRQLKKNVQGLANVRCHQTGIWADTKKVNFIPSNHSIHDQVAVIDEDGTAEIKVTSIDDFLDGNKITFIKMDPGGNIIPEILQGAQKTITTFQPKLALGAYHGIKSIFELPILLHSIDQEYALFLRHNTYHLCDTDLFATPKP